MIGACGFETCSMPVRTSGLCNGHYLQSWRGQKLRPLRTVVYASLAERMAAHTTKSDGCWTWTGAVDRAGYGQIGVDGGVRRAHRVAYELAHEQIPDGIEIDHICHNPPCVNPEHLRMATRKQNGEHRHGAQTNSTTGVRGVSKVGKKWRARVKHHGRTVVVGHYATIAEANAAVIAVRNDLFTHNNADRVVA